jgi:hypothetical protein
MSADVHDDELAAIEKIETVRTRCKDLPPSSSVTSVAK